MSACVCMAKWSWPGVWCAQGSPLQRGCRWTTPAPGSLRPSGASHATLVLSECAAACSHCQKSPWLWRTDAQTCPLCPHMRTHTHILYSSLPMSLQPSSGGHPGLGLASEARRYEDAGWCGPLEDLVKRGRGDTACSMSLSPWYPPVRQSQALSTCIMNEISPHDFHQRHKVQTQDIAFFILLSFPNQPLVLLTSVWHEPGWKKRMELKRTTAG